jgi:type I restriction enzyme, S subunit
MRKPRPYRTRLVADLVTGKLDVREEVANLPEELEPDINADDPERTHESELQDEEITQ